MLFSLSFPRNSTVPVTYLLLAIYCHKHHQEKVGIKRVRELRVKTQNELRASEHQNPLASDFIDPSPAPLYAKA